MEKEIIRTLCITLSYFIIGAIAILRINRNKDNASRKNLWLKYGTYFFIVHFILSVILFFPNAFQYIALLITCGGLYEILRISKSSLFTALTLTVLFFYLIVAIGFLYFSRFCRMNELLFLYTIVFVFDGFSQISGQLFGKRKLSPVISPNKTIEGLAGGLVVACLTSYLISSGTRLETLVYTTIICFASLFGDLAASHYKRKRGVKDYSHLIPGHGGILDRFDSLIAAGSISGLFTILHFL